jgi:prevent-host-death family protein
MTELDEAKAREEFPTLLDRVVDDKEQVVLTRRGKPVAVLVPAEDWVPAAVKEETHRPDPAALQRLDALIEKARSNKQDLPEIRPDPEWQRRFDDVVQRIQSHIPPELASEEIEAEVREAREEVRRERRARRH